MSPEFAQALADAINRGEKIPRLCYFGHDVLETYEDDQAKWQCVKCSHTWRGKDGWECPRCRVMKDPPRWHCDSCNAAWYGSHGVFCPCCGKAKLPNPPTSIESIDLSNS